MADEYMDRYSVRVYTDKETLKITKEFWNASDGLPHRDGDMPAYQEFDRETGNRTKAVYYLDGQVHRDHNFGPAELAWNPKNGQIVFEAYRSYGAPHRTGGKPALIEYHPDTGDVLAEQYFIRGDEYDPSTGEPLHIDDEEWDYDEVKPAIL